MTHWRWPLAALALAIAARTAGAQAAEPEPGDIAAFPVDEVELVDTADTGIATIEIRLADGATADNVDVDVVEPAEVKARGLDGAFRVARKTQAAIELAVDFARVSRPLTYKVTLSVREKPPAPSAKQPGAPAAQPPAAQPPAAKPPWKPVIRTIRLTHPAARARAIPDALVIEREGWLPGGGAWKLPVLELEETSGLSRLVPSGLDLRATKSGDEVLAISLKLTPGPVAMGRREAVAIEVVGNVPGGTASGKAELRAPQLAEAVVLTYELRSRVRAEMIALVLLAGLAIGLAIKAGVRWLIERVRLRREIAEIAKQAVDARVAPDAILVDRLNAVEDACLAALGEPPSRLAVMRTPPAATQPATPAPQGAPPQPETPAATAALKTVRDAQRKALDEALADWAARVAEQKTQVAAFAKAVDTPWLMPPELVPWLDALRTHGARARTAIERGDAEGARTTIEAAIEHAKVTTQAIQDWRTSLLTLASELETRPTQADTPWPDAAAAIAPSIAARLAELMKAIERLPPPDAATLATLLANIHTVQAYLEDSAVQMASTWSLVVSAAAQELSELPANPLARLADSLPRRGADAAAYLGAIARQGEVVVKAFRDRLLGGLPEAVRGEVDQLIQSGKWSRAAARFLELSSRQGQAMGGPAAAPAVEPFSAAAPAPAGLPAAAWPVIATFGDVNVALRRALRAERTAAWLTSIVSFAILAVLYFIHYLPQPIGTWPELLAVFAQALTLDVGVDAVAQAVKGLVK